MKSYSKHLTTTLSFGETMPRNYRPTMRSSAVFPVRLDGSRVDAVVTFLGYWFLKRSIPEVTVLLNLRSESGEMLAVKSLVIDCVKSFKWSLRDLVDNVDGVDSTGFRGSIEVEIFSSRDMVFPYPAVTFAYSTPMGLSFVHTCGRIYNDINDLSSNTEVTVAETGFDVFPGDEYDPFFSFVNGPIASDDCSLSLELVKSTGETMEVERNLGAIAPYASVWANVFQLAAERTFFGGSVGTVKIRHKFKGFFPRFVVGNVYHDGEATSLTHSYYDTSEDNDPGALWTNPNMDNFYDSVFSFPVSAQFDRTELAIYPIFASRTMALHLHFFGSEGHPIEEVMRVLPAASEDQKVQYINISAILAEMQAPPELALCKVIIEGGGIVPTRLKFGLNFGGQGVVLPSNVCFGSMVSNEKIAQKSGSFKWCTLFDPEVQSIFFTNASFLRHESPSAAIQISLWRESDLECMTWEILLAGDSVAEVIAARRDEIAEFLSGQVGWLTAQADNPYLNGFYITNYGLGMVGADHVY